VTEGIIQFKSQPAGNLKIPRDVLWIRRAVFSFEKKALARCRSTATSILISAFR
jgi:hypothetical protein